MATSRISGPAGRSPAFALAEPGKKNGLVRFFDTLGDLTLEYWALFLTVVMGILVFAALSVPFLSYFGLDTLSKTIFYALHYVCAQIPSHSFYIFGHQLGMCARNFSIYASMFLMSLFFVLSKKRLPGIPWWLWVLMMVPIAVDGLTQMFGLRESNWMLRVLTGTLFGAGNIWFALPLMQKSLETPVPQAYYAAMRNTKLGLAEVPQTAMPTPIIPVAHPVQAESAATNKATPQQPMQEEKAEQTVQADDHPA